MERLQQRTVILERPSNRKLGGYTIWVLDFKELSNWCFIRTWFVLLHFLIKRILSHCNKMKIRVDFFSHGKLRSGNSLDNKTKNKNWGVEQLMEKIIHNVYFSKIFMKIVDVELVLLSGEVIFFFISKFLYLYFIFYITNSKMSWTV